MLEPFGITVVVDSRQELGERTGRLAQYNASTARGVKADVGDNE